MSDYKLKEVLINDRTGEVFSVDDIVEIRTYDMYDGVVFTGRIENITNEFVKVDASKTNRSDVRTIQFFKIKSIIKVETGTPQKPESEE